MHSTFQKSLSVLLALFFSIIAGWQNGSSLASQTAQASPPPCHCCNPDRSNCATPACCARPADNRSPVTPVAPRCASGQEWHVIAPPALTLLTLQSRTVLGAPVRPSAIQVEAVPIFTRHCSFLI